MHIGFLSHWFYPETGALAGRAYEFSRLWHSSGCRVSIVTALPNHPDGQIRPAYRGKRSVVEMIDGVAVHRKWLIPNARRTATGLILNHGSLATHTIASAILGRVPKPDVWVTSSPPLFTAAAGAVIAQFQGVPFIFEVRDLWPDYFAEMGVLTNKVALAPLYALESYLYRNSAAVVCVADTARDRLIEQKRLVPAKVFTVPNGAALARFNAKPEAASSIRLTLGLADKLVVAYIGNHGLGQGIEAVVQAAAALRPVSDVHFLFVGDGAQKPRAVALADKLRLSNTTFLGTQPRDEVPAYYQAADICLVPLADVPSFRQTIPSKLFEIMASERPVIGAVAGETASVIDRAGAGLVVPPQDSKAIARAVLQLRDIGPEGRTAIGRRARSFVAQHFDRHKLAQKYLEILQRVGLPREIDGHRMMNPPSCPNIT